MILLNIFEITLPLTNPVLKFLVILIVILAAPILLNKLKIPHILGLITAANSINAHQQTILAYFKNRSTNALAENFNAKIKAFRSVFRGINDIAFYIYRVSLIFA